MFPGSAEPKKRRCPVFNTVLKLGFDQVLYERLANKAPMDSMCLQMEDFFSGTLEVGEAVEPTSCASGFPGSGINVF